MPAKYAKNKYSRPGERNHDQAMVAQQDKVNGEKRAEAYENLINSWPLRRPPFGVYRSFRGDFMQIVKAGDDFMRQDFPASQQALEPGYLWMPALVLGFPGTWFHEESQYGFDEFQYVLVEPMAVSFNCVETDGDMEIYQRKPIIISTNAMKETVWEAVSIDQFDPSQEYFSVSPNGDTQTHPARNYFPTPSPSPGAATVLAVVPGQQLDTAGDIFPPSHFEYDGMDYSTGYDNPISNLGDGIDVTFGNDVAVPSLNDGADLSFGDDNSAGNLPDGFQLLVDFNNPVDTPAQTDNASYPGYAPAQCWRQS
jgi:hypothetical protein